MAGTVVVFPLENIQESLDRCLDLPGVKQQFTVIDQQTDIVRTIRQFLHDPLATFFKRLVIPEPGCGLGENLVVTADQVSWRPRATGPGTAGQASIHSIECDHLADRERHEQPSLGKVTPPGGCRSWREGGMRAIPDRAAIGQA